MPSSSPKKDPSNGWDAVADRFIAARSRIGVDVVRAWSRALSTRAAVLDLGCGAGVPVSETLVAEGCAVHGIDASPTLVQAFRRRFPDAAVACEPVEASDFFGRSYDGIVAVGLLFLLPPDTQRAVIRRVASVLNPGGRFLFTAPTQVATWADLLTGRSSVSPGDLEYRRALSDAGLTVLQEHVDEGENHYYDAVAATRASPRAR